MDFFLVQQPLFAIRESERNFFNSIVNIYYNTSLMKYNPKMLTHIGSESLRFAPKYIAFILGRRFFIFAI